MRDGHAARRSSSRVREPSTRRSARDDRVADVGGRAERVRERDRQRPEDHGDGTPTRGHPERRPEALHLDRPHDRAPDGEDDGEQAEDGEGRRPQAERCLLRPVRPPRAWVSCGYAGEPGEGWLRAWIACTASIVSASSGRLSGRYPFTRAKRSASPPG